MPKRLSDLIVIIRGAGEMATGTACRLHRAGMFRLLMTEIPQPLAVRRMVSFSEAVYEQTWVVEGIRAASIRFADESHHLWRKRIVPVIVDPDNISGRFLGPHILVDAILAKQNLGTAMGDADLVIGMGPGFYAGRDVHYAVETNRGHDLGRLIERGEAAPDTGVPGEIAGHTALRVIRSPSAGLFASDLKIGTTVEGGQVVGYVSDSPVESRLGGVLRGLVRSGIFVPEGLKIGDVDPRGDTSYCTRISDKARAIGGTVLEAILTKYNSVAT